MGGLTEWGWEKREIEIQQERTTTLGTMNTITSVSTSASPSKPPSRAPPYLEGPLRFVIDIHVPPCTGNEFSQQDVCASN